MGNQGHLGAPFDAVLPAADVVVLLTQAASLGGAARIPFMSKCGTLAVIFRCLFDPFIFLEIGALAGLLEKYGSSFHHVLLDFVGLLLFWLASVVFGTLASGNWISNWEAFLKVMAS